MPVKKKGNKLLERTGYKKFKKRISRAVAEYIRDNPEEGENLHEIVKKTLEVEKYKEFFDNLTQKIKKTVRVDEAEASKSASILVDEEISQEIQKNVPGLVSTPLGKESKDHIKQGLHRKLRSLGVLKGEYVERIVGTKTLVGESIRRFFRKRTVFIKILGLGMGLIIVSGVLLGSVYNALIVGLTLDAIPTESIPGMIGNIVGGLGGIIIFFTFVSLGVTYFLEKERKREQISKMADEYLKKTEKTE